MDLSQGAVSSSPKIMLTVSFVEKDGSIPAATFVEALVFTCPVIMWFLAS